MVWVVAALLALLAAPALPLQVWVSNPHTVALLFQPVLLRCHYRTSSSSSSSSSSSPIITWKYKSFCATPEAGSDLPPSSSSSSSSSSCPDSSRTVRIVATKQGDLVTLGEFYQGRSVTVLGGAELSLGPAAWGDSGIYICTVTSLQDLVGNNEAVAELVVLGSLSEASDLLPGVQFGSLPDWLFVLLVALGALLVALGAGLCWCQCCPHTCCCLLRCPCCPQRCCCPEALYFAGKAATSGGVLAAYGHPPPALALQTLASSHSSQVPLLRDNDGSTVTAPSLPPPPPVLRYLEDQIEAFEPQGRYPHSRPGPPPSDISSLHEPPDSWDPPRRPPPRTPPSPPPPCKGRWHSEEFLGGSSWGGSASSSSSSRPPPPPRARSRSRDDLLGGVKGEGGPEPGTKRPPGPPRKLRKDALSRESLVV